MDKNFWVKYSPILYKKKKKKKNKEKFFSYVIEVY